MNEPRPEIRNPVFRIGVVLVCGLAAYLAVPAPATAIGLDDLLARSLQQSPSFAASNAALSPRKYLKWDAPEGVFKFNAYVGPARGVWTNSEVLTTNQIAIVPGVHYGVASVSSNGLESTLAYWPSNAIYIKILWSTTDGTNWNKEADLGETAEPVKLLRMESRMIRME